MCFAICVMGKTSRPLAQASVRGSSSPPRHVPPARHFIFSQPLPFPSLFLRPIFSTPLSLPSFLHRSAPHLSISSLPLSRPSQRGNTDAERRRHAKQGRRHGPGPGQRHTAPAGPWWHRTVTARGAAEHGGNAGFLRTSSGSLHGQRRRLRAAAAANAREEWLRRIFLFNL